VLFHLQLYTKATNTCSFWFCCGSMAGLVASKMQH
jgi:hypothetical protein